jgi:CheY-like chemotaxis protein
MPLSPSLLLADDDHELRLGVAELLSALGLRILHAEDGREALEIVRTESIDGALLDMHMPGHTGIEVVPLLREEREGLPCIVYSGRWTPDLEQEVLRAGAVACLKKPVQPDLLRREVQRILGLGPFGSCPSPDLN